MPDARSLPAVTGRTRPVLLRRLPRPFFRRLAGDGRVNAVIWPSYRRQASQFGQLPCTAPAGVGGAAL
ncbi:MAG: hypothetical protein DLM56_01375 [Pseudonocardiales bacterium]|nr:MAG: hypothetical protein DLM56_01375 [Pseudonocardiales bacterium]